MSASPVRTCVGCRKRDLRSNLVRLVVREESLLVDPGASMDGRGAWLHPCGDCLERARRQRSFDRALRGRFEVRGVADQLRLIATRMGREWPQTPESGLDADGHPMSTQR